MNKWLGLALRVAAASIMLQTLYFKFTGSDESVYIFSTMGMEPWGRFGTGLGELAAALLLLWPRSIFWGGLMGLALMSGALAAHFTRLGLVVKEDGGELFLLALFVWLCCLTLVWTHRSAMPRIFSGLSPRRP